MTWIYRQKTGELVRDESVIATGYSGKGEWKNDPESQNLHNRGPIPRGIYRMQEPRDSQSHGPYAIPLAPHLDNQMFARGNFLIHGDSKAHPGEASEGCIILNPVARAQMWASGDHDLEVTE